MPIKTGFQDILPDDPSMVLTGDGTWAVAAAGGEPIPGEDGVDGYTPIKGVDYFDGADSVVPGPPGEQGIQGEPGVGNFEFPVGWILQSFCNINPGTFIGYGTWTLTAQGRVLVGLNAGDADFDAAEETGGAKTHTLTDAEMPTHRHQTLRERSATTGTASTPIARTVDTSSTLDAAVYTEEQGGGVAHNNVQPFIVAYFWRRTV